MLSKSQKNWSRSDLDLGGAPLVTVLANADLEHSYAEAEEDFRARNPKSATLYEKACDVMPGGNTRSVLHYAPYPLTFAKGS